jgi:hypothetical protein
VIMFTTNQFTGFLAIARRYRFSRTILFGLLIITALFGFYASANPVEAQSQPLVWTPQQRIPGYLDRTEPPVLVADSTGIVHAFAYQQIGNPDDGRQIGIIYSSWTYEDGWNLPTDIILSPVQNQARVMDVYLDPGGIFHLVFYGGDEEEAYLFYSRAHIRHAYRASGWTRPIVIGERPLTPSLARLTGDGQGNLLVFYIANLDGPGLFSIASADNGAAWDDPLPFFLTYNRFHRLGDIAMRWGQANRLHLTWQIVDDRGQNVGGYYSQMNGVNGNWTTPMLIDEGIGVSRGMGVANATVVEHDGQIILAYNNGIPPEGVPPTNWIRVSQDNGQTWTDRARISREHVGRNGRLSFVVDSSNRLYLFFGLRIPTGGVTAIHGMWYTIWQDGEWSRSEAVVSGPGGRGFDPYDARAIITLGNRLLLTWRTDPGNSQPGVWFSATVLDSPSIAAGSISLPTPAPPGSALDTGASDRAPSSIALALTPAPPLANDIAAENLTAPRAFSIILIQSVVPVLVLVGLFMALSFWQKDRDQRRMWGK